jgi:Flp pilus assembly protein TadG
MRLPRLALALIGSRSGGAAIEFGVLSPVFFTLLLGTIDLGRMFYVRQGLEYAAEQSARYLMMNPGTSNSTVTTYLQGQMPGGMGSSVSVSYNTTTNCNGYNNSVTCTTITATYSYSFIVGFLGLGTKTLKAKADAVSY